MNTYTIYLSAGTTGNTITLSSSVITGRSHIIFNVANVTESTLPSRIIVDWGDGSDIETFSTGYYKKYRVDSIINEVLYGKLSPILSVDYSHAYTPSESSRFKTLSCQFLIEYSDDTFNKFIIPLSILTEDFYDSIEDMTLIGVNILPTEENSKEYVIHCSKNGYITTLNNLNGTT